MPPLRTGDWTSVGAAYIGDIIVHENGNLLACTQRAKRTLFFVLCASHYTAAFVEKT